ncbi:hypothetical protein PENFLA_c096G08622 [Penicillium flavigenum]|uniref:MADS-box domain-containing protein n=2 Tax=Penicillium flavigenum TaxID=254877 RepID=A0A1V6S7M7_9EURO|nr:hypothetical protein PENFLA_c096G08622 [Penicillium flavigenum]
MSKESPWVKKRQSESARAKTQQRNRRQRSLFKKAKEFVLECESDVFLAVRVRKTGQIYIFDSSIKNQWLKDLSNMESCYPRPIQESVEIAPELGEALSKQGDGSAFPKV